MTQVPRSGVARELSSGLEFTKSADPVGQIILIIYSIATITVGKDTSIF